VEEKQCAGEKDKVTRRMERWGSSTAACGGNQGAWELAAGGGEGGRTAAAAEQRTERRQRRKRKAISQGPVCKTEETQGPYSKLTFSTNTEI
jgi:hypothetical protein